MGISASIRLGSAARINASNSFGSSPKVLNPKTYVIPQMEAPRGRQARSRKTFSRVSTGGGYVSAERSAPSTPRMTGGAGEHLVSGFRHGKPEAEEPDGIHLQEGEGSGFPARRPGRLYGCWPRGNQHGEEIRPDAGLSVASPGAGDVDGEAVDVTPCNAPAMFHDECQGGLSGASAELEHAVGKGLLQEWADGGGDAVPCPGTVDEAAKGLREVFADERVGPFRIPDEFAKQGVVGLADDVMDPRGVELVGCRHVISRG